MSESHAADHSFIHNEYVRRACRKCQMRSGDRILSIPMMKENINYVPSLKISISAELVALS